MYKLLFGIFFANGILILTYQIISLYWKVIEVGVWGFIVIYFSVLTIFIFGIKNLSMEMEPGLYFSLGLSVIGFAVFSVSIIVSRSDKVKAMKVPAMIVSYVILGLSIVQLVLSGFLILLTIIH